jgi:hypothetical protein
MKEYKEKAIKFMAENTPTIQELARKTLDLVKDYNSLSLEEKVELSNDQDFRKTVEVYQKLVQIL